MQRLTAGTGRALRPRTTAASSPRACAADVNVIDFEHVGIQAPEMVFDLPAGAGRMIQRSTGYVATVVAGETVVEGGECTGAMPGALVRGPQAAPVG